MFQLVEIVTGMIYGIRRTRSFSLAVVMPVSTLQNHLDRYVLIVTSGGLNQQRTGIIDVFLYTYFPLLLLATTHQLIHGVSHVCSEDGGDTTLIKMRQMKRHITLRNLHLKSLLLLKVGLGLVLLVLELWDLAWQLIWLNQTSAFLVMMSYFEHDGGAKGKASGQPNYGGGAFYTTNPGSVSPATVNIPLHMPKELKAREKELQAREAELKRREQVDHQNFPQ
ncbi:unnamed protein product [Vicia faba]|uniref:Uncharacterized protein n=1 Tax=Vicia faba TaxID=3906 RepID=A0AAV0ZDJ8_VICFA|nr:unnamed protein product [Vicia faba]